MNTKLQVILNHEEYAQFEEIRKYYQNLFGMKLNNSDVLRFIIQKEHNWENGIELVVSNKMDN